MKKVKIITRWAHDSTFAADIVMVISEWADFLTGAKEYCEGERFDELKYKYDKHGHQPSVDGVQFPFAGGGSMIWIKPEVGVSTMVHEIVHAAHHLLKCRSTPLSEDTEETYAYLIESIFKKLSTKPSVKKRTRARVKSK